VEIIGVHANFFGSKRFPVVLTTLEETLRLKSAGTSKLNGMSMEEEAVVADIDSAGRLLSDSISRDVRYGTGDLSDVLDNARFATHPYSSPNKEVSHQFV
jgi:hypothetical protein